MFKNAFTAILVLVSASGCGRRGGDFDSVEFVTMGTTASVKTRGGSLAAARDAARGVYGEVERLLNAHDPASELNALAKLPDDEVLRRCSAMVRPCYEAAFRLERETGGAFSPRWRGATTLDLGAIAKGFALDLAAREVASSSAGETLLDLGGNLKAVTGTWRIGVHGGGEVFDLKPGEAVATSGEYYRGGHIKDARTGEKVATKAYSVTVVHPDSAMLADALSTVLYILGPVKGDAFLKERCPRARAYWINADGSR